jgi:hypothetical protein
MELNSILGVLGAISAIISAIVGVIVYFHTSAMVLIREIDAKYSEKLEELQKSLVVIEKDMIRESQPVSGYHNLQSIKPSVEGMIEELQVSDQENKRSIDSIKRVVKTHQGWLKELMRKD